MDGSLLILLLIVLILGSIGWFLLRRFLNKTRKEFREYQPTLRVTNLSTMSTADVVTLTPEVENLGPGVAYDSLLQLTGWDGSFSVKALHPHGPRYQRHSIPIVLGPDAPIRMKPMSRCFLRLSYRDCWEQLYDCWYPVVQVQNVNNRLYNIRIDLSQPEFTEPHPSVREMWKLLRRSSHDEDQESHE
ncbi:MAG: hypothetical protein OEV99_16285 [Nitrospira sp.]|nr:hypothetical protein [Nitrospira sp.]MDH4371381.1 hypothetical protein [Nitrospira sp.]MDH5347565.1 hypothetical protein [Nitrospira sp.]MDH5498976.1 hypothetical protein [Nitrospira sp.]